MLEKKEYKIGSKITLDEALDFSLYIACLGKGLVEPNPCVGAVLIDEEKNELISYGYHEIFGGPHAEVNCFKNIENAKGLTLIVTLEPCSHFGKTPPCADLVIEKKIKKLIYISKDPNPQVSGKGFQKITEAGIEIEKADLKYEDQNEILNHNFFYTMRNKKSYIHLKWAESNDGKTIVREGSPWITGGESKEHVHFLRAQSQAVLIGRNTLEIDDPSLNVRKKGYEKSLKVIVFDPFLKSFDKIEDKKVYKIRESKDIIYLCDKKPENSKGLSFLELRKKDNYWDLDQLAVDLYKEFGVQSVFVEGGSKTISEFIKQKKYNRISKFRAPHVLGLNGLGEISMESDKPNTLIKSLYGKDELQDFYFF